MEWIPTVIAIVTTLLVVVLFSFNWLWLGLPKRKNGICYDRIEYSDSSPLTRISIAHPKHLSKRFSSKILVSLYSPVVRATVRFMIQREFNKQKHREHMMNAELPQDKSLTIRLTSPSIKFSESVTCNSDTDRFSTTFIAMPTDDCAHGSHAVKIEVTGMESKHEYFSSSFQIKVSDFVFDHVSQPLLSRATAFVLCCTSIATFTLTYCQMIDKTFGIASGTTAAVVSTAIYSRFLWLFRRSTSHDLAR